MKKLLLLITLLPSLLKADPYPKNQHLDIQHYRFQFELSDDSDKIYGKTSVTALFKKAGMNSLRLDLVNNNEEGQGMKVTAVMTGEQNLEYTHENDVLTILFDATSVANDRMDFVISYEGIPITGLKIGPNKYGDRTFFSDNWPNKGRNWLPMVDHISDKATSEMVITAPEKYQVISNGLLMEESNLGNGIKKTHWKQSVPISPWLYVLGVAEFAIQYVDDFDGKSIQTWVYRQDRDAGFYDFAVPTKHSLEFFTDYVGPFQYEKLANIQANSVGGGMEAASAILYGDKSVTGERTTRWRNVIIHEVAHQWFGNAVTEKTWDHVWLSEGFATYFTLLFREHAYGREDFVAGLLDAKDRVYKFYEDNKDYRIVHEDLRDMAKVVTGQTYQKGAWILHMLRNQIGDVAFQQGITNYYSKFVNGLATTDDFQYEMESISGQDLDWFFKQWLYGGGQIVLDAKWSYNEKKGEVTVDISQVQDDGFLFKFPIEFGVYMDGEVLPKIEKKWVEGEKVSFKFSVDQAPVDFVIDPQTKLLAQWSLTAE